MLCCTLKITTIFEQHKLKGAVGKDVLGFGFLANAISNKYELQK